MSESRSVKTSRCLQIHNMFCREETTLAEDSRILESISTLIDFGDDELLSLAIGRRKHDTKDNG